MVELQEKLKGNKEKCVVLDGKLFLDEFNYVFHDELIELPPIMEVNHSIDLVVNVAPISTTSYCTSLAQIKE